jgi:S1-C subfamily serine protease
VRELAGLYRKVWSLGAAGIEIPITIYRDGKTIETRIKSGDRNRFLKAPKLH